MYNPWFVHADEIKWHGYEIINNLSEKNKKYDAILVNVCHKKFKAYTTNDYEQLSNGEKVIIDIKNIVDKPAWRLYWKVTWKYLVEKSE